MTHPILKLFKPALECRSAAEAEAYLRRHPVLLQRERPHSSELSTRLTEIQ